MSSKFFDSKVGDPVEYIRSLQIEWNEALEEFTNFKNEKSNDDLFGSIDYLAYCDQLCEYILRESKDIDYISEHLSEESKYTNELKKIKKQMQESLTSIEENYEVLAEQALRKTQDVITQLTIKLQNEKLMPSVQNEITQNLESELYLQELKDTLENYRQAREAYMDQIKSNNKFKRASSRNPHTLDEKAELDPIISELDTTITACDTALLIKEISE